MTNKEKLLAIAIEEDTSIFEEIAERRKNRATILQSQDIALKVLLRLELLGWSKRDLAKKMQVSPQQISKIVRGTENLTLSTIVKLQEVLDIPLLASYYERTIENLTDIVFEASMNIQDSSVTSPENVSEYRNSSPVELGSFKQRIAS